MNLMNIRTKKHGSRTARVPVLNNCKSFPWTSLFQMPCTKPLMSHLSHWILVASVALRNALTSPIFVVPFKHLTYLWCIVFKTTLFIWYQLWRLWQPICYSSCFTVVRNINKSSVLHLLYNITFTVWQMFK